MSKNSEPHDKSRYAGKIFISLVLIRLGSQPFKDINVVRFFILSIADNQSPLSVRVFGQGGGGI